MSHWYHRALLYKVMATIPQGEALLGAVRTRIGGLKHFTLGKRLGAINEMLEMYQHSGESVVGKHIAEIGSGWHPYLAAIFYCMGAAKITLTDISPHIQQEYVVQTINYLLENLEHISEATGLSTHQLRVRLLELDPKEKAWQEVWQERGISYYAPFDFTRTDWSEKAVDMVYSNSCLGYVPRPILEKIGRESCRILKNGGWLMHNITTYDDYSSSDRSISAINFLKFSERSWSLIGNSKLHFQNRLRPNAYLTLFGAAGFHTHYAVRKQLSIKPGMINRKMLDTEFQTISDEELFCSHFLYVGKKL